MIFDILYHISLTTFTISKLSVQSLWRGLFCSLVVLDSCGFGMRASCGNLIDSSLVKLWGLGNNRLRLLASQLLDLIHLLDFKFLHVPRWKIYSGCLGGFAAVFLCVCFFASDGFCSRKTTTEILQYTVKPGSAPRWKYWYVVSCWIPSSLSPLRYGKPICLTWETPANCFELC